MATYHHVTSNGAMCLTAAWVQPVATLGAARMLARPAASLPSKHWYNLPHASNLWMPCRQEAARVVRPRQDPKRHWESALWHLVAGSKGAPHIAAQCWSCGPWSSDEVQRWRQGNIHEDSPRADHELWPTEPQKWPKRSDTKPDITLKHASAKNVHRTPKEAAPKHQQLRWLCCTALQVIFLGKCILFTAFIKQSSILFLPFSQNEDFWRMKNCREEYPKM